MASLFRGVDISANSNCHGEPLWRRGHLGKFHNKQAEIASKIKDFFAMTLPLLEFLKFIFAHIIYKKTK